MKYVLILMLFAVVACSRESRSNDNAFGPDVANSNLIAPNIDGEWSSSSGLGSQYGQMSLLTIKDGKFTLIAGYSGYSAGGSSTWLKRTVTGSIRVLSDRYEMIFENPTCYLGKIQTIYFSANPPGHHEIVFGNPGTSDAYAYVKGPGRGAPPGIEENACKYVSNLKFSDRKPANIKGSK